MKRSALPILAATLFGTAQVHAEVLSAIAEKEFKTYVDPFGPLAGRMAEKMSDPEDPANRQELSQQIFMGISTAYMALSQGNPRHPSFWPISMPAFNWFAPNPDDAYTVAPIEGDGVYRLSGFRGTVGRDWRG